MSELTTETSSVADEPFAHTDVDYIEPLIVKLNKKTRANQAVAKQYGAIFTYLSSCALHIELAGDLPTDSFILVLRRFIFRRGWPKSSTSDKGNNVVGAQRELSEAFQKLDNSRMKDDLTQRCLIWKFNWPSGGAMESMDKIPKKALKSVVRDRTFTGENLSTFLTKVESIINSRPLAAVSDNINDLELIIPGEKIKFRNWKPSTYFRLKQVSFRLAFRQNFWSQTQPRGRIRVVKVKIANVEYVRPAGNLYLLEHLSLYSNNE